MTKRTIKKLCIAQKCEGVDTLYNVSQIIAASNSIESAGDLLIEEVMTYINSTILYISLINEKTGELEIVSQQFKRLGKELSKNLSKSFINADDIIVRTVLDEKKALIINNTMTDERLANKSYLLISLICAPIIYRNKAIGIVMVGSDRLANYGTRELKFCSLVGLQLGNFIENIRLQENIKENFYDTIIGLAEFSEMKKNCEGRTIKRVSRYCMDIAKALELSDSEQVQVKLASMIYDIGKIGVNDEVLKKKGELTREELHSIKQHPILGAEAIKKIEQLKHLAPIIRAHHERFDGAGYPDGLKGKDIPLISRIIAVADAFDAMVSDKSCESALNINNAVGELKKNRGIQYDPEVVDVFLKAFKGKTLGEIHDYIYKEQ